MCQVRNSSTLLFSTLITRIFGVKKGKDEHSKKNRSAASPQTLMFTVVHQRRKKRCKMNRRLHQAHVDCHLTVRGEVQRCAA